jgi:hypothetical protein
MRIAFRKITGEALILHAILSMAVVMLVLPCVIRRGITIYQIF